VLFALAGLLVTADTLHYAVTLTSDPVTMVFDLWLWTFVVYRLCRGQTLSQIWAKWSNCRQSYCDFSIWRNDHENLSRCATRVEFRPSTYSFL